jgi:MYXO-CTERM domain-containing protein
VDYSWGDLVGQPAPVTATPADFQNALTHELGHVVGLDHNCYTTNDGQARLNDNTGTPELDCYGNPPPPDAVTAATMYPSVLLTDTQRRDLSADDVQGVCEIYPHAHDVCPPSPEGGCSVASPGVSPRPWPEISCALFAAFLAVLAFRRSRERV